MNADSCKEQCQFILGNAPRQLTPSTNVVTPGYDGIRYFLITSVGQVIVEHAQGNQPASDCCWRTSNTLLPLNETINVVNRDYLWRKVICPLEKNPYITGAMNYGTGAWFSAPPVFLKALIYSCGNIKSPL